MSRAHPYMPNSTPELHRELLDAVGAPDVESLFVQIPPEHRLKGTLDLPPALPSEVALRRHLLDLLARNETCERNLSFLGGGIWQHHVPAVVDEINWTWRLPWPVDTWLDREDTVARADELRAWTRDADR